METKFFKCDVCGNFVGMIHSSGVDMVCCGQDMTPVIANTVEASYEKHIPEVKMENGIMKVTAGSVIHPMEAKHYIDWIYVETEKGGQRKKCEKTPTAEFSFVNDKPLAVYEYCNLHGLWKKDI